MINLIVKELKTELISKKAMIFTEKRTISISKVIITSDNEIFYIHLYDLNSNFDFIIGSGTLKKIFTKSSLLKVCKHFYVIRSTVSYKSLEYFCHLFLSNKILQTIEL